MTDLTLAGGRVVDPATGRDAVANVRIAAGVVVEVGGPVVGEVVDVSGCVVAPGLVDPHVHLREPGGEESETIDSGTRAAALGGYTAVSAMANTTPVPDVPDRIADVRARAATAWCDVAPVSAITMGLAGEEVVDFAAMAAAGVRYASDDGRPVGSAHVMRTALVSAARNGIVIGNHSEEPTLTVGAQANEGRPATSAGLTGWPHEAEETMIARDIILAEGAGARLHVPHISTAQSVDIIRWAKARGVRVTAEATPHHFTLTDELVRTRDSVFKVNPPLRSRDDVRAVREGLRDGVIDMIATDHAPHADEHKAVDWEQAPCGMLGLETALGLALTQLVRDDGMSLSRVVAAMSTVPARTFGFDDHGGPLVPGAAANLVVFDPQAAWTVRTEQSASRSRNGPFEGFQLHGRVVHTLLRGNFTVRDGAIVEASHTDRVT